MDGFGAAAKIRAFDKRQGGNPVLFNGWWYYANGAKMEDDSLGAMCEPLGNEYENLKNICCYHQGQLAQAVRQFDVFKEQLMMAPSPDRAAVDELKRLQAVVGERNQAVEKAKQRLADTPEGKRREEIRQYDAEQKAALASFKDIVKSVRI